MIKWLIKHNIVLWLLSVFVSILLWAYVMVVQDPEQSITINGIVPVFAGEEGIFADRNLKIVEGRKNTVSVRFSGRRTDLAKLNRDNVVVTLDLSNITGAGSHSLRCSVEPPAAVASRVSYVPPDFFTIKVDTLSSKMVNVRFVLSGDVSKGFLAKKEILEPQEITVSGPTNVLDTISYAQIEMVRASIDKTVEVALPVKLMTSSGQEVILSEDLTIDVSMISVILPIHMTKTIPLKVEFIDGGGLRQDKNIIHNIDPPEITISGDPADIESRNSLNVGTINLGELIAPGVLEFPIILPDGVSNDSGVDKAAVSVDIYGVTTKMISTDNISVINYVPPNGYSVEIFTQQVGVTVRGPEESVKTIEPGQIKVVADMTNHNLAMGRFSVPVSVYLEEHADVGVVGEYSIVIELVEISQEDQ